MLITDTGILRITLRLLLFIFLLQTIIYWALSMLRDSLLQHIQRSIPRVRDPSVRATRSGPTRTPNCCIVSKVNQVYTRTTHTHVFDIGKEQQGPYDAFLWNARVNSLNVRVNIFNTNHRSSQLSSMIGTHLKLSHTTCAGNLPKKIPWFTVSTAF